MANEIADLNGDGNLDYVQASDIGIVAVVLGNGNGSFKAPVSFTSGAGIASIMIGDLNRDGYLDVVGTKMPAATSFGVFVFLGNGNGSLQAAVTNFIDPGINNAYGGDLGDVNGDGILDLVVGGNGQPPYLALGTGTGGFGQGVSLGSSAITSEFGDLNNDGNLDIVTGFTDYQVILGNGNGTFKARTQYAPDYRVSELADVNEDGYLDLIAHGPGGSNFVAVELGNGNGTFSASASMPTSFASSFSADTLAVGDFTGDGVLDFAVAGTNAINYIELFAGNGHNTAFLPSMTLMSASGRNDALQVIDQSFERIGRELGRVGAVQSRLLVAASMIRSTREEYRAAQARIEDADVAQDGAVLMRENILQRAGAAILANANQQPMIALSLLSV